MKIQKLKGPCCSFEKLENVEYISNSLEQDLLTLANVSNLIIGFGTFGFLLYLMNPFLKNLYIPLWKLINKDQLFVRQLLKQL